MTTAPLLSVENLQTHFITFDGVVKAVDEVSFALDQGETLGIVGESGCGKSVTALSIMRLIRSRPGRIVGGPDPVRGPDLTSSPATAEMREVRGNHIAMIFQEPMTSLNPVLHHRRPDRRDAHAPPEPEHAGRPGDRACECSGAGAASPTPRSALHEYPAPAVRAACASGP